MSESEKQQAIHAATCIRPDDSAWTRILIGRARWDEAAADRADRRKRNRMKYIQRHPSTKVA